MGMDAIASGQGDDAGQGVAAVCAMTTGRIVVDGDICSAADAESQVLEAVYQKVNPSVVEVVSLAQSGQASTAVAVPQGEGSGIVWDKQHPVLTRKDFMGSYEIAYYGWKEGAGHKFFGPNNVPDLWHVKKVSPQKMVHLTEKPVELAVRAMQYSSCPGENVLDLFGGSGSTLVAGAAMQQAHRVNGGEVHFGAAGVDQPRGQARPQGSGRLAHRPDGRRTHRGTRARRRRAIEPA